MALQEIRVVHHSLLAVVPQADTDLVQVDLTQICNGNLLLTRLLPRQKQSAEHFLLGQSRPLSLRK